MPRGDHDRNFEFAIAQLYGQINIQIVQFAASVGVQADRVAERLSELLSPERSRVLHHLSAMRQDTTGVHRSVESVEVVVDAHRKQPSLAIAASAETRKAHPYWSKMSPEERSREMKRRQKKWSKEAKAKWTGNKTTNPKVKAKKRVVYQARYAAKKRGEPLPPLPGETGQAVA